MGPKNRYLFKRINQINFDNPLKMRRWMNLHNLFIPTYYLLEKKLKHQNNYNDSS